MARKKQISTTINEKVYKEIKERGYKISDLIEKGLEYLEKENKVLNKEYLENLIKRLEESINKISEITNENIKKKISELLEFLESEREELMSKKIISRHDIDRSFIRIGEKIKELFNL